MKNAVLLHGTGSTPDAFWFGWLRRELEKNGFTVTAPQLPDAENPRLDTWTPFALQNAKFNEDTIIVGHSAGCPLILSILNALTHPVRRVVLVAGFINRLKDMQPDNPMLLAAPDWEKIKRNGHDFYMLNADNDPWGCDHHQGEAIRQKVGGYLIVATGEGHFGSKVFEQPYETFPLLRDLCLLS